MHQYTTTLLVHPAIDELHREADSRRLAALGRPARPGVRVSILGRLDAMLRFAHPRPHSARG